jgi:hypothetical protein
LLAPETPEEVAGTLDNVVFPTAIERSTVSTSARPPAGSRSLTMRKNESTEVRASGRSFDRIRLLEDTRKASHCSRPNARGPSRYSSQAISRMPGAAAITFP